jgi:hypothetical protein
MKNSDQGKSPTWLIVKRILFGAVFVLMAGYVFTPSAPPPLSDSVTFLHRILDFPKPLVETALLVPLSRRSDYDGYTHGNVACFVDQTWPVYRGLRCTRRTPSDSDAGLFIFEQGRRRRSLIET